MYNDFLELDRSTYLIMLSASERPWIYNRQKINLYPKNHMNWLFFSSAIFFERLKGVE